MTWETFAWERQPASAAEVRDRVIDWLRQELVGPSPGYPAVQVNGEEILRPQDPPRYRYACGVLFPRGITYSGALSSADDLRGIEDAEPVEAAPAGEDDEEFETSPTTGDAGDATEEEVEGTSAFVPSTMGLSFLADVRGGLKVDVTWGTYASREIQAWVPGEFEDPPRVRKRPPNLNYWFRTGHAHSRNIAAGDLLGDRVVRRQAELYSVERARLVLDVVSRPWRDGRRLVTLTLMNASTESTRINEQCFFQCGFTVTPVGGTAVEPYPERPEDDQDYEEQSLALLYRHRPTYAVGHGCAADWTVSEGAVRSLATEVMPRFQQPPVLARGSLPGVELSLGRLARASAADVVTACESLVNAYEVWIDERAAELGTLSGSLREAGERHLAECRKCALRMRDGVVLLGDADILYAFQAMNGAMLEQRLHYQLSADGRRWTSRDREHVPATPYVRPPADDRVAWRPFQLAFILMNLRSLADATSPERELVDVIWFPTGGGKTEAYLGLAACEILLRRLRDPEDGGAFVLMRYTLRLLTTQQFQRAASLICALELIRRKDPRTFGRTTISIGLWLGGSVTPNRHKDAVESLVELEKETGGNKFVVLSCPWCGVDMGPRDYGPGTRVFGYRRASGEGVRFVCEDPDCEFSTDDGLPLAVVDDAIYERPPTLLIGTVDKFAQMPWEPNSRKIFGIDNPLAKGPPSLIIQDELHLISGPLGSMVGHYETVIDELCTATGGGRRPPKIVASTATIARAPEQVRAVYGRRSSLFPPQGLRAGESFFAQEGDQKDGRTYVGVLGSAVSSHVTAQVRTVAALLQAPRLAGGTDAMVDPYWTLMCYFNSLRELGRAATLINADIREYLNSVWDRIGLRDELLPGAKTLRRFIDRPEELTSRRSSSEIPEILQRLFGRLPNREVIDICLATNMIQVGLDVSRLSIMTVVGQPKGASEYIQASSRVGRDLSLPGLVVTNYNPFKPRDRSHFETFRSFHENVYRYVEPTSVTPFSLPVCERAIHALVVTLVRFLDPERRSAPDKGLPPALRKKVREIILKRIEAVDKDELGRATPILDAFLDDWDRVRPNVYGRSNGAINPNEEPLLWPAGQQMPGSLADNPTIRPTASSLRNVDAECEARQIKDFEAKVAS